MISCTLIIDLKRLREKLFRMKKRNISTVQEKSDEFVVIRIQKKYSQLVDKINGNIHTV